MRQALSDVLVVELSGEPAGAYCGKVFADLGAEVVKVEPPGGDPWRRQRGAFLHLNTNKRSVVLDPRQGPAALFELLEQGDVVVQSLGAGDLAGYGTTWQAVRDVFPSLVVTSV